MDSDLPTLNEHHDEKQAEKAKVIAAAGLNEPMTDPGTVLRTPAEDEQPSEPALGLFLAFLERDMARHPERLQVATPSMVLRAQNLVAGMDIDVDAPLEPDTE